MRLADLIRDGLAMAHREPLMSVGQQQIDVGRMRIADAGRRTLGNATLRPRAENAISDYLAFLHIMQLTVAARSNC
jgi:hypothetical protein